MILMAQIIRKNYLPPFLVCLILLIFISSMYLQKLGTYYQGSQSEPQTASSA